MPQEQYKKRSMILKLKTFAVTAMFILAVQVAHSQTLDPKNRLERKLI